MTNAETAAYLRNWVSNSEEHRRGVFGWATDACGYEQHMRFVEHRNRNWEGGDRDTWKAFILAYADSLDATPTSTPAAGRGK